MLDTDECVVQANDLWSRLEAMMERVVPGSTAWLQPPATQAQLARAERALGLTFPQQLRCSYLRHNGNRVEQAPDGRLNWPPFTFFDGVLFLSLDELVRQWTAQQEGSDQLRAEEDYESHFQALAPWWDHFPIRQEWFNRFWIPVGGSDRPDYYIDMAPGPKGKLGQLIAVSDMGGTEGCVKAPSFFDWIEFVIRSFDNGRFTLNSTGGWVDNNKFWFRYDPYDVLNNPRSSQEQ